MTVDTLFDVVACPRCDGHPLSRNVETVRCKSCKTDFPLIGEIPWLFAEPSATLAEWQNRLHFELRRLAHECERLQAAQSKPDLDPLAGRRLARQLSATNEHRAALQRLLSPLGLQSRDAAYESHLALRTRLPTDQALDTYYANVHRDWCWGDEENAASLAEIRQVLERAGKLPAGNADVLVLGSGASRLAYDLHMQLSPARTLALDFNPLLLLIASVIARGEKLQLYEFPIAPRSLDDFALLRDLAAPAPARDGLHFVLADGVRPPFRDAAFDLVVTPWFVDIVSEDLPRLAARINRLLKAGGCWTNFGSLAFDHPDRERRYSPEETVAIVCNAGFEAPIVSENVIPYLCSPASRHGRRELVFSFAATKANEVASPARHKALPDWIVTGKEPVPLLPSFQTQAVSTRIYSFVMSLIDGRRSISDMARMLEQQKLMTQEEAIPAIRSFLIRMYDDSQRRSEF